MIQSMSWLQIVEIDASTLTRIRLIDFVYLLQFLFEYENLAPINHSYLHPPRATSPEIFMLGEAEYRTKCRREKHAHPIFLVQHQHLPDDPRMLNMPAGRTHSCRSSGTGLSAQNKNEVCHSRSSGHLGIQRNAYVTTSTI